MIAALTREYPKTADTDENKIDPIHSGIRTGETLSLKPSRLEKFKLANGDTGMPTISKTDEPAA